MSGLLIFLHGVGSNGNDLAGLGGQMATRLGMRSASPDAPHPFDQGGMGRQWFSIAGVTEANRPTRVQAARAGFDAVLNRILVETGFEDRLDKVALIGFSQGSIMALDAVASGRWPVGAVVAFSGRLASPAPLSAATGTPVLLLHGKADAVMPHGLADQACLALQKAGVAAEVQKLPGVGHTISNEGVGLALTFLSKAMAAP